MDDLNICIVGCGAIGSLMAVHLIDGGSRVTLLDRGAQLRALETHGLSLIYGDEIRWHKRDLKVTGNIRECGVQDVVILAVKAHQIAELCPDIRALFKPETVVVTVQNGIPWWYFQKTQGPYADNSLTSLDPGGRIAATIDAERIIGCVAYPAAELTEPGIVRHIEGHTFPLGELDGVETIRSRQISDRFTAAGLKAPIVDDIRAEIWLKSWGALAFNPISALTHATMRQICQDEATRDHVVRLMTEAAAIAAKLGVTFRVPMERRLRGAERVGDHRTSMLQDLEAGRRLEIDAILGSIVELGELTGVDIPNLKALLALTKLRNKINLCELELSRYRANDDCSQYATGSRGHSA